MLGEVESNDLVHAGSREGISDDGRRRVFRAAAAASGVPVVPSSDLAQLRPRDLGDRCGGHPCEGRRGGSTGTVGD